LILPRLRTHAAETLMGARAAGLTTSLDTNWDPHGLWMHDLAPCLPHLDYLFLNEDEARMVTGTAEPAPAARAVLARGVETVVIKLGPRGCAIYDGDREVLAPAYDVPVKDTTGAGDCFVAAFLCARLRGADFSEAGQFANAVAALNVQKIGAGIGACSWDEVHEWMRSAPVRVIGSAAIPNN
jgi:sugar/nucleoside kinase (ribokinase family)